MRPCWLDDLARDVRHALRALVHNRAVAIVAVLTLGVGIAANTAVFSVADALLVQPLPYPDADRLVALRSTHRAADTPGNGASSARDLADWQAQAKSFEAIAGYRWRSVDLRGGASSQRLHGLYVMPEYFDVFGIAPVTGRVFTASDRGTNTIVLGRRIWGERFSANPASIGSVLDVNMINLGRSGATPNVVIGAALADAHFPPLTADFNLGIGNEDDTIDFWLPELPPSERRDNRGLDVVGKLGPGITVARAQAEMDAVASHLAEAFPDTNKDWGVQVVPLRAQLVGGARRVVLLLSLGTGLVLLIACGNVSTLLLIRGLVREREIAVRAAIGASRGRIARQFLVESLLIAAAAGALGAGGSAAGIAFLRPWFPAGVPLARHVATSFGELAFAIAVAALTACLIGVVPAWIVSARPFGGLNARGQTAGRWHHRAVSALIAAQVGLTIVLLVSTGLLLRSAEHLWRVDPGFSRDHILTMTISLPNNKFDWQHNVTFERDVTAAVKTLPGVRDAAAIQGVPMRAGGFWTNFSVDGMRSTRPADLPAAHLRVISAGYFRVLQIPLLEGRDFDQRDDTGERGHPKFVIVNRTLAARFWPGESAAGKRLREAFNPNEWVTVAGVAGDVRYAGLDAPPELEIYLPDGIFPESAMTLLVKTAGSPLLAAGATRARIAEIDSEAFVSDVKSMDDLIGDSLASRSFATLLLTLCAAVALVLALSGIYAIVAQAAVQRKLEIGIRMALGATGARVVGLMLRRSTAPVMVGVAAGLLSTLATTHLLSAMLFGVQPFDPLTLGAVTALFATVALASALVPARRATHVDPLIALRCE
jgi:putative ABC transport system permease protein